MKAVLERCTVVVLALICAVRAAYSADLPTAGAAKESGATSNCFASLWNWLNASVSDCPLTYHGFTVYGTVDVGYGYDTAGIGFGKWYRQGRLLPYPENERSRALVLVAGRIERFNPRCEDGGADWR